MVFCAAYAPRTSQTHFLPWPQLSSPSPSPHRPPLEPTLVWAGWLFFHFPFPAHMHFFEKYAHVRLLLFFLSNTHQLLETIIYIHSLTALVLQGACSILSLWAPGEHSTGRWIWSEVQVAKTETGRCRDEGGHSSCNCC